MWVSPGAGCSESMMPRCKWGAAAIQVRGQQLGLFNSQPNPTLFSSPVFPCLNPHLWGWRRWLKGLGEGGETAMGGTSSVPTVAGDGTHRCPGLGRGWESKLGGEEDF